MRSKNPSRKGSRCTCACTLGVRDPKALRYRPVAKREPLHLRLHRMQRRFFAGASQHLTRLIADDQTADEWAQSGSDAPRAAASIEQPPIGWETQERYQARRIG